MKLREIIESANTGLDAIKRAPIINYDSGIKCLRIGDISQKKSFSEWGFTEVSLENYKKFKLKKEDLIIARTGATVGVNKYIDTEFKSVYNNGLIRLRTKKGNNSLYVYYLLQSKKFKDHINSIAFGTSTQPNIQINDLLSFEIPNIDIDRQNKIAKILSLIDKRIELNKAINKNLQKLSQELYRHWFIDFEFPNEYGKPYKSSGGKMIKSELCEIPEGWDVGYISDGFLTTIIKPGIDIYDYEKKYVATADVEDVSIKNTQDISYNNRPSRANMQPINNSVWFSKMQGSNKNILVDKNCKSIINDYIFSTGFMGLECKKNSVYYIWNYINTESFLILKDNMSTGTLMAGLSNSVMNSFKYPIPVQRLLDNFNKNIASLYSVIFNNNDMNSNLENLKNILLPKLMNGEIDLDKIEI